MSVGALSAHEQPYTVYRRVDDGDSTYGPDDEEYEALDTTRSLYLHTERDTVEVVTAGEHVETSVRGYARESVDVQEDDRVDFGGSRYEIEQRTPQYDGNGTVLFYELQLRSV